MGDKDVKIEGNIQGVGVVTGGVVYQTFNKIPKSIRWLIGIGAISSFAYYGVSLSQTNEIVKSSERQEMTLQTINEKLDSLKIYGDKTKFLKEYFGDDWRKVLENPQTYNNLKLKLINSKSNTDKLLRERKELLEDIQSRKLNDSLKKMVYKAFEELRYDDVRDLLDEFIEKNQDIGDDLIQAHYLKALSYMEELEYQKAKEEFEEFIPVGIKDANILNQYATLYYRLGKYKESESLFFKVLTTRKILLGEEHPDIAISYNDLGLLYQSMGRYKKAEGFYLKALKKWEKVLGKEHLYTGILYGNLAELYELVGIYKKAEFFHIKSLKISKKLLGEKHPNTATSYNNLAGFYHSIGAYKKAKPLYIKALEITKNGLGEEHPSTATSYNNLGGFYQSIKEYKKAEQLYLKALKIWKKILGKSHPNIAISYNNLANLYKLMEEDKKAESFYLKALKIRERMLGKEHLSTATLYHNISVFYYSQRNYTKAYSYIKRAVVIRSKILPKEHPLLLNSKEGLEMIKLKLKENK